MYESKGAAEELEIYMHNKILKYAGDLQNEISKQVEDCSQKLAALGFLTEE